MPIKWVSQKQNPSVFGRARLGDDFDPEAFTADEINRRFAPLERLRNKAAAAKKSPKCLPPENRHSVPHAGLPKPHACCSAYCGRSSFASS